MDNVEIIEENYPASSDELSDKMADDAENKTETKSNRKPVGLSFICLRLAHNENDKAPVLLVHGMFGFKEMWYGLMTLLAVKTERRVCSVDLRNHGDSPWSDEFDTAIMAKDVKLLLDSRKFEKVVLLGHSLGGKVAAHFALTYPDRVEKLIIEEMLPNVNTFPKELIEKSQNTSWLKTNAEAALKTIPDGVTELEAKRAVYRFLKEENEKQNEPTDWSDATIYHIPIQYKDGKWSWKSNVDVLDEATRNVHKTMPHSYGQFDGPSLFIYGGQSVVKLDEVKDEILEQFPKAELFKVEEAHHIVHPFPEYKEKVVKFILR